MWRDAGHDVHYVQNVTDVDDPLLERAAHTGESWVELAAREIDLFRDDMTALRVLPPDDYIGAVEAVPEITVAIEALLDSGAAYRVGEDIYFDSSATGRFGDESHYDRDTMLRLFGERGGDPDHAGKRDPLDALLWRGAPLGRAVLGHPARQGPSRLAHRVHGDRRSTGSGWASTSRAAGRTWPSRTTRTPRRTPRRSAATHRSRSTTCTPG